MPQFTTAVLVLSAQSVDSTGEDGKPIKGVAVGYVALEEPTPKPGQFGNKPSKAWLSLDLFGRFQGVGVYEGRFDVSAGSDGRLQTKLVDVNFIKKVDLLTLVGK